MWLLWLVSLVLPQAEIWLPLRGASRARGRPWKVEAVCMEGPADLDVHRRMLQVVDKVNVESMKSNILYRIYMAMLNLPA